MNALPLPPAPPLPFGYVPVGARPDWPLPPPPPPAAAPAPPLPPLVPCAESIVNPSVVLLSEPPPPLPPLFLTAANAWSYPTPPPPPLAETIIPVPVNDVSCPLLPAGDNELLEPVPA